MKKRISKILLSLLLLCVTLTAVPAKADYTEYYDWDDESESDEEDDDYEYENDDVVDYYDFSKVSKRYDKRKLSTDSKIKIKFKNQIMGYTHIIPINVKKTGAYKIGFDDTSYGECSFCLMKESGENIIENYNYSFSFNKWSKEIKLSKGTYYLKILSLCSIGLDYEVYATPLKYIKKAEFKYQISSCNVKKLRPKLGKGKWKTSNSNIIQLQTPKVSNTCVVRAKKNGKAVVTYTNSNGSKIKYVFKVRSSRTYPVDRGNFEMNSVGGLEPSILISNNSDLKIKYVQLKISFYNGVGDKIVNDIGGSQYATLKITGPIKPWRFKWYYWDPVFYNTSARKMKIESAIITYFGNKSKYITVNRKFNIE